MRHNIILKPKARLQAVFFVGLRFILFLYSCRLWWITSTDTQLIRAGLKLVVCLTSSQQK